MTAMSNDAEIHTLATPYALHSLPDDEVASFEQHLEVCESCRAEVDEIRETSSRLGLATTTTTPEHLRTSVLQAISNVRPLPPLSQPVDDDEPGVAPHPEVTRVRAKQRHRPVAAVLAAAAAAVIAVLGVQLNDARDDLNRAEATAEQVRDLVAADDVEVVRALQDDSKGTVILSRSKGAALVFAEGMNPAPTDHVYQLWSIQPGEVRSAGVVEADDGGQLGPFLAQLGEDAEQLGITIEPAGGSQQPTTEPIMVLELPT